jgi:hypothetical protein
MAAFLVSAGPAGFNKQNPMDISGPSIKIKSGQS